MSKREAYEELADLASGQWGLVTSAQAARRGVAPYHLTRLQKDGVISRVRHGVYVLGGASATWLEDVRAEWLATDPSRRLNERARDEEQVVVADETAARIYGFGDFSSDGIRLSSPRREQTRQPHVTIAQRQMSPREWTVIDGLPVTTPRRTLEDITRSGRWEQQHLAKAVDDALGLGLITADDIARSKVLMGVVPELAPPTSHRGVLRLLRDDAVKHGMSAQAWQDNFFRFQFANALMKEGGEWVIKGGSGIMCRFADARATQDIDVFQEGGSDRTSAALELVGRMGGAVVGEYTFECELETMGSRDDGLSTGVNVRVIVDNREVWRFSIDVSDGIVLDQGPDTMLVHRPDSALIKGYPSRAVIRLYPVENQIADKIGAMYSQYGEFGNRPSTRYHDLYDIALLADRLAVDADRLRAALLAKEARTPGGRLPSRLVPPGPDWPGDYAKAMSKALNVVEPYTDYDTAMQIAAAVADPVLAEIEDSRSTSQAHHRHLRDSI